jgi:hypothetical protein
MKTKTIFQDLQLEVGQRAICTAGYPHKGTVVVECIKDFCEAADTSDIVNSPYKYIKVYNSGKYGLLTSHLISCNWVKI